MMRLSVLTGSLLVALALVVSAGQTGDDKKDQPKKKVQLPPGWGKLKLSDEQKKKVYETRGSFQAKIEALKDQIEQMKKQETIELVKLLTEGQRKQLAEILKEKLPEIPPDKKPDKEK